jgi:membrane-associated progesterone receptor component
VYLALRGTVFDVSSGRRFYGQGGSYNVYAGKEISRALAKSSFEEEDMNDDLTTLTAAQLETLDKWEANTFRRKYPIVGKVVQ